MIKVTDVSVCVQAYTLGMIDELGLQRVAASACNDLRWARVRHAKQQVDWEVIVGQINADLKAANEVLPEARQVSPGCTGQQISGV